MTVLQGKRLLCATDLSHPNLETERTALQIARMLGDQLTFVHVLEDAPLFLGPMPFEEGQKWQQLETRYRGELLAQTLEKTEAALAPLRSAGEHFHVTVKLGNTENEILALGNDMREPFGAVIVGRHHHNRIYSAFFGSVAQRIVEQSQIPVIVLPIVENEGQADFIHIGLATALRHDAQVSEKILDDLLRTDEKKERVAHIAHCFERVSPGYSGFETTDAYVTYRELELIYDMAESRLDLAVQEKVRQLVEQGFRAQGHLLVGNAEQELLHFVKDNNIQVIVFGRHQRSGQFRFHVSRMLRNFIRKTTCVTIIG
jgi:nucleotide-binding universal stress UspA family protein